MSHEEKPQTDTEDPRGVEILKRCLRKAGLDDELVIDVADACAFSELDAVSLGCPELSPADVAEKLYLTHDEAKSVLAVCREALVSGYDFKDPEPVSPAEQFTETSCTADQASLPLAPPEPETTASNFYRASSDDGSLDLDFSDAGARSKEHKPNGIHTNLQRASLGLLSSSITSSVDLQAQDIDSVEGGQPIVQTLRSQLNGKGLSAQAQTPQAGTLASQLAIRAVEHEKQQVQKKQQQEEQQRIRAEAAAAKAAAKAAALASKRAAINKPANSASNRCSPSTFVPPCTNTQPTTLPRSVSAKGPCSPSALPSAKTKPCTPPVSYSTSYTSKQQLTSPRLAVSRQVTSPKPSDRNSKIPLPPPVASVTPCDSPTAGHSRLASPRLTNDVIPGVASPVSVSSKSRLPSPRITSDVVASPTNTTTLPSPLMTPTQMSNIPVLCQSSTSILSDEVKNADGDGDTDVTPVAIVSTADKLAIAAAVANARYADHNLNYKGPSSAPVTKEVHARTILMPRPLGTNFTLIDHTPLSQECSWQDTEDGTQSSANGMPAVTSMSDAGGSTLNSLSRPVKESTAVPAKPVSGRATAESTLSPTQSTSTQLDRRTVASNSSIRTRPLTLDSSGLLSTRSARLSMGPSYRQLQLPSVMTSTVPSYQRPTAAFKAAVHTRIAEVCGEDPAAATAAALGVARTSTAFGSTMPKGGRQIQPKAYSMVLRRSDLESPPAGPRRTVFAHISASLLRPTKAFLAWTHGNGKHREGGQWDPHQQQQHASAAPGSMPTMTTAHTAGDPTKASPQRGSGSNTATGAAGKGRRLSSVSSPRNLPSSEQVQAGCVQ